MTDADALLAAVLAAPADDLPRLVFADFLQDGGEPMAVARAEFIRVQVALTRPDEFAPPRLQELLIREKALLAAFADRWLDPLRRRGEPLFSRRSHGQFRRGFVEVVWMPAGWFVAKADRLFARCPVRELRVTLGTAAEFADLFACPALPRLEAVDLSDRKLGNWAAGAVAAAVPRWPAGRLKRVLLRACEIDDDGADVLADIPAAVFAPDELDVSLNPLGDRGRRRLRDRYGAAVRVA